MIRLLTRPAFMVAAVAATVVLAGCVNLPTSGPAPHPGSPAPPSTGGLAQQIGVEIDPIAPGPDFSPKQIVGGFLAASGADQKIAEKYLTPSFAPMWKPSQRATRVIDSSPSVRAFQGGSHVTGSQPSEQVVVSTDHLALLVSGSSKSGGSNSGGDEEPGQLSVAPGGPFTFTFDLTQNGQGAWRIDGIEDQNDKPDPSLLLLTEADFQRDYLPRDLYFPANETASTLVPSPVYISTTADQLGVQELVNGLAAEDSDRVSWLWRSVTTADPGGVRMEAQVRGSTAFVSLHGLKGDLPSNAVHQLEAQLVWTLTQSPYSGSTGIASVQFQPGRGANPALLGLHNFARWGPPSVPGPLFYQTLDDLGVPQLTEVSVVSASRAGKGPARSTEQLPTGVGDGPLSSLAVSPSQPGTSFTTSFGGCRGKNVYVAPLEPFAVVGLLKTTLPSKCTSLSWDDKGELWVTAGSDVFVITETPNGLHVIPVTIPWTSGTDTYTSLKVAPDGVRVAMIVKSGKSSSVYVAAISKKRSLTYLGQGSQTLTVGPDLVDPTALTWWNGDQLLVIDSGGSEPRLYSVPLDGGKSVAVPTPDGAVSVAANGAVTAIGTIDQKDPSQVKVLYSRDLDGIWTSLGPGASATYPG